MCSFKNDVELACISLAPRLWPCPPKRTIIKLRNPGEAFVELFELNVHWDVSLFCIFPELT